MSLAVDRTTALLAGCVIAILVLASVVGAILARRPGDAGYRETVALLNARMRGGWVMFGVFIVAILSCARGVILFGLTPFWRSVSS